MSGTAWAEWVAGQAAADELARWKQQLLKASPVRRYRSDTHTDARFPLGGIGTGNFELSPTGQFTTWQLFNTLRDGHIPFFFAVRAGKTAKLLQTTGGPDWPRIHAIEMTGEYPIAHLRYADADVPVQLEMTAFSPFAPLDTRLSSMPLACFIFKIQNSTGKKQRVSLGAFMQNPVGYDAMGVPVSFNSVGFNAVGERLAAVHPNYEGNFNEYLREGRASGIRFRAKAGKKATLDRPVRLYTNLPVNALNAPPSDHPDKLTILGLERLAADLEEAQSPLRAQPTSAVILLEDAPSALAAQHLQRAKVAVELGANLVFSGTTMPLLQSYADVTEGKPLDRANLKPDILFEDFESGYDGWKVEGTAFGEQPAAGTLPGQQRVSGFLGKGLVNTFLNGDTTTGKLISRSFAIERNYVRFLIGGGSSASTQFRLLIEGRIVRAQSGRDEERLLPAVWDVREFRGQNAHFEIVDEATGGWGHINVDHIEFSDLPGSAVVMEILEDLMPLRFSGLRSRDGRVEFLKAEPRQSPPILKSEPDGAVIYSRSVGKGWTHLGNGPVLETSQFELTGARQRAYVRLCALAQSNYAAPDGVQSDMPGYGELSLAAVSDTTTAMLQFEDWAKAWEQFSGQGGFGKIPEPNVPLPPIAPSRSGHTVNGAVAVEVEVPAGKTVEVPFLLAWRYPNKYNWGGVKMGNHYAETWKESKTVIREAAQNLSMIREKTERFRRTFYDSNLPYWLLDCVSSQISTIRHIGVVFRIANGDVYGWEGSNGCCQPTCTHVWGYEQTLSRLFPDLERDMRRIDLLHQQRPDGGINNRTEVPSPRRPTGEQPFADGHASCILKAYREALNYPDGSWLKTHWPRIRSAVDYLVARDAATSQGEPNGVLEDDQWNTYDQVLNGVTTFISGYYLAALRAGEELAKRCGEPATAEKYRAIFEKGQKRLIELCWNGEYFQQHLPGYERLPGTVGPGCMSDQLIGQWWAHQLGLGYILPREMVITALRSIFKYNWIPDLTNWQHSPRAFAGAKDKGLIIVTWPRGGRPPHVMLYSDEVWTGIEYQVAAHMLYEGLIEEGLSIIKGARDRYDGIPRAPIPRSPWNEIECGGHYARAMSSWSLLLALSGFRYDGITGQLQFAPNMTPERYKSFFCASEGWGSLTQSRQGNAQKNEIYMAEGRLRVSQLVLETHRSGATGRQYRVQVALNRKPIAAVVSRTGDQLQIVMTSPIVLQAGDRLRVSTA
jgi:uncharacterized protein (DUF608 family)